MASSEADVAGRLSALGSYDDVEADWGDVVRRADRIRRTRRVRQNAAMAAGVVAAAAVGALVLPFGSKREDISPIGQGRQTIVDGTASTAADVVGPVKIVWSSAIPASISDINNSALAGVHQGSVTLVWSESGDWALVDQLTKTSRPFPRDLGLFSFRSKAVATDGKFVVWSGEGPVRLIDPVTGAVTASAPPPRELLSPAVAVRTSDDAVLFAGSRARASSAALSYDPHTDRWRTLRDLPMPLEFGEAATLSDGAVVLGGTRMGDVELETGSFRWNGEADTWSMTVAPPLFGMGLSMATLSDEAVLAVDYDLKAAVFDGHTWNSIDGPALSTCNSMPSSATNGTTVLLSYCDGAALFDVETRRWESVDPPAGGLFAVSGDGGWTLVGSSALYFGELVGA